MAENKTKKVKEGKPLTPEQKMLAWYQRKLTFEAILKSGVFGLLAGFLLMILISIISFATKFNALWISLSVWAVSSVGLSVLLYFTVFKTTVEKTASRMDGMGLDERVITMLELKDSDSVIAKRQRADTQCVLQNATPKKMKFGGLKLFVVFASILGAIAVAAILMTSFSTYQAVQASNEPPPSGIETPVSDEDKIINKMLEDLREVIAEANIKEDLRDRLNGMVDDLEKRLYPTDSLEVKIAKISETSQLIHKLLQEAMELSTIPEELQKHDTTKDLGAALESENPDRIIKAFDDMYASIEPLAAAQKYEQLQQTAYDILQSIEDAEYKDEELAEVLEELAKAFLEAIKIPPPPEGDGDEEKGDEIDQAVQDALEDAKDSILGMLPDMSNKDDIAQTDKDLGDIFQDAMESLGQEPADKDKDDDNGDEASKGDEEGDASSPSHSDANGDIVYDSVIDGKTPYDTVYDEYYQKAVEMLTRGDLTDEQREVIEKYLELLTTLK